MKRKLSTLQQVSRLEPIPGADRIEVCWIKGWSVIVGKGLYKVGDWLVYHEIDSCWKEGTEPYAKDLEARGTKLCQLPDNTTASVYLIKTLKLRGTLSQGYCVPLTSYTPKEQAYFKKHLKEDYDLTKYLGTIKFEKPELNRRVIKPPKNKLAKFKWIILQYLKSKLPWAFPAKFNKDFPHYIQRTSCARIQNVLDDMWENYQVGVANEISYKLDGSSITLYTHKKELGICSHNTKRNLKDTDDAFIKAGTPYLEKIKHVAGSYAFQGELVSPSIQQNFEGVTKPAIYFFSVWDIQRKRYIHPTEAIMLCNELGLPFVPIMYGGAILRDIYPDVESKEELLQILLKAAEGPSGLSGKYREGIVIKPLKEGYSSVKVISNKYLLKKASK